MRGVDVDGADRMIDPRVREVAEVAGRSSDCATMTGCRVRIISSSIPMTRKNTRA
jgi:hypothetical protein